MVAAGWWDYSDGYIGGTMVADTLKRMDGRTFGNRSKINKLNLFKLHLYRQEILTNEQVRTHE